MITKARIVLHYIYHAFYFVIINKTKVLNFLTTVETQSQKMFSWSTHVKLDVFLKYINFNGHSFLKNTCHFLSTILWS